MIANFEKQVARAKVNMLTKPEWAFMAYATLQLPVSADESVSTACTNGTQIKVNPSYFDGLKESQRQFLLAHEVMHVVLHHITRLGTRDPQKFNIAADYVINHILTTQGFDMIKGGMLDARYADMTTEQVYDLLPDNTSMPQSMQDIEYSSGLDEEQTSQLEQEVQSIIQKAAIQAQMSYAKDSIPEAIQRYLQQLVKPKVNWKIVLRRFLTDLDRADYSWTKPRKRMLTHGMYLPALKSTTLSKLSFAIDTSGSVSNQEFTAFISEVATVLKIMKPTELELMQFDHRLRSVDIIRNITDLQHVEFQGHGGTDPDVALEAFEESNSKALFVITDGYFGTLQVKPKRPVVWVIFNNPEFIAPFGRVIHVNT